MTETTIRTGRDSYMYDGKAVIGRVVRTERGWVAYVTSAWDELELHRVGWEPFSLKRDAQAEVVIMREV